MSHASHFLSRLERVSAGHVELALSLYRDPRLVREVLDRFSIPESTERVALSLADRERGPFLVMGRDGSFITCLAAGMSPGQLRVVSRGQLDAARAWVLQRRQREELAHHLTQGKRTEHKLLSRLLAAEPRLSREEFLGLSAFQNLLKVGYLALWLGILNDVDRFSRKVCAIDKPLPQLRRSIGAYWGTIQSLGHTAILASIDSRDWFAAPPEELLPLRRSFGVPLFQFREFGLAIRAIWAMAKLGKVLLPEYKQHYAEAEHPIIFLGVGGALVVTALRYPSCRAEIAKVLGRSAGRPLDEHDSSGAIRKIREKFLAELVRVLEQPEPAMGALIRGGRRWAVELSAPLPAESRWRYSSEEQVPEALACTLIANASGDLLTGDLLGYLLHCLPWLARAEPEELYLPAAARNAYNLGWDPRVALQAAQVWEGVLSPPKPVKVERAPGRNEPCRCGSGRKFKRCCGAS